VDNERRSGELPCNHKFAYIDVMLGINIIHCCSCNWFKEIKGRPIRKTDMTHKEFTQLKEDFK
jgi:hypothetical protein